MSSGGIDSQRLILAGLAAGAWVVVSGILMAASFGYRDMKEAFDATGLAIPHGLQPFALHTAVRLVMGMATVALFAIMLRAVSPMQALLGAAAFTWLLGVVLPYAVVAGWGLFGWPVAARLWAWGAGELLIAATIGRLIYRT
jgi:hypothetical protein